MGSHHVLSKLDQRANGGGGEDGFMRDGSGEAQLRWIETI